MYKLLQTLIRTCKSQSLNDNLAKIRTALKLAASPTVVADFNTLLTVMNDADIKVFGERIGGSVYMGNIAKYFGDLVAANPGFIAAFSARFSSGRIIFMPAAEGQVEQHRFTFTADGSFLVEIKMFANQFETLFKTQVMAML